MNDNYITTCECDGCHAKHVPCVMIHHNGTPILAECVNCQPAVFESAAREDIVRWLNEGYTYSLGRKAA